MVDRLKDKYFRILKYLCRLSLNPKNKVNYEWLVYILEQQGRFKEAEEQKLKVKEINKDEIHSDDSEKLIEKHHERRFKFCSQAIKVIINNLN